MGSTKDAETMLLRETSPAQKKPTVCQDYLPWSAWVCVAFGVLQAVASAVVWFAYGTGPLMPIPAVNEIAHFHRAKVMLLPAMLLETSYIVSGKHNGNQLHGYDMSFLVILEYTVKMLCYSTMAHFDGGIVHRNLRAWGTPRGCYTVRFLEWSIAVPTLLALNNYPILGCDSMKKFVRRLWPNLFVTWAYILASWLAEVTPDEFAGWFLLILSFAAYVAAVVDQVVIVQTSRGRLAGATFKIGVVIVKEVVFTMYGLIYLLGIAGIMSSEAEQMFYTYGDVMLKVVQASILVVVRNWEELEKMQLALENEVLTNKEDMTRLFERANAPIFTIDSEGIVTGWNELLMRASGIHPDEALGKPILEVVREECRESVSAAIESCRQGLLSAALEVTLGIRDKEPQVTLFMNLVVQVGTSSGSSMVGIGQDFTELLHLKSNQERKARFTAILGHELRSPLHGIMGLSGSMASDEGTFAKKKQLNMIHNCASRLLDLVTNIMEMSKAERTAENDEQTLQGHPVNVMDIVEEVFAMTEAAVDKNGKKLKIAEVQLINNMRTGELPLVNGDAYKITQVIYNLVTNATKFTKSGHVALHAKHLPAESMIEVSVEDTGKGIAPGALKRIFEPFEQEDPKDSRSFQGVGLGLSVAQSIAKLHGGEITVKSVVNSGTTFTVRLPCDNENMVGLTMKCEDDTGVQPGAMPATLEQPIQAARPSARPLVLSVDDEDVNQEVIETALANEYRIVRASSGDQALTYLKSAQEMPAIMLLDVMMPGLTGFDVATAIRKQFRLSHAQLPIMMLSARSPAEDTALQGFKCGTTDFIQKPFNSHLLRMRLRVMEELRHLRTPVPTSPQTMDKFPEATVCDKVSVSTNTWPELPLMHKAHNSIATQTTLVECNRGVQAFTATLQTLKDEAAQKSVPGRFCIWSDASDGPASTVNTQKTSSGLATIQRLEMEIERANMAADFRKCEADIWQSKIKALREKLDKHKTEAWLQRQRADALERELCFMKTSMGR